MTNISYQQLSPLHFDRVIALGNHVHGDNYIDLPALQKIYQGSQKNDVNASWVALDGEKLVGFRLTIAAEQWTPDKWCTPADWHIPVDKVCYFKCNTVDADYRGYGIGSQMLRRSVESARQQGAQGGLAHIWLASPGNSAFKYFSKCGGTTIKEHPGKWRYECLHEGYVCPECGSDCWCVGAEMLLNFDQATFR